MKPTRKYTCTRRINKEEKKIWVVLEVGKRFYRIFNTQTDAIEYFKPLKTCAEMMVQQSIGNKFIKIVYTKEEMARKGIKNTFKSITHKIVKDSDKLFEEEKPSPKPNDKQIEVIKEININKIINIDSNTGEIISDEKLEIIRKSNENQMNENKPSNLILELEKLDEERISDFEKHDTFNISIIDEILNRKQLVENTWNEPLTIIEEDIEDTIYVKEELEKPIIISSQKIEFDDDQLKEEKTIENIIEQKTEGIDVQSVNYGEIKEHADYKNTQIQNFQDKSINNNAKIMKSAKKSSSDAKFWVMTILISLLLMALVTIITLYCLQLNK